MGSRKRAPTIVAVKLDPVGAVANLIAHDAGEAVDAVGFLGDTALGGDDFDRAIALQPSLVTAHNNRGLSLRQDGRLEEAIASHDRALVERLSREVKLERGKLAEAVT